MSKRAGKITLDPLHSAHSLFELLPSGRCYRALNTRTSRHRNSLFPPINQSHEHLTLNVVHTTLLYNYLFTTHTYFFSFQICTSNLTHNCLYCILCFCHFVHCHLYIVLLLSVSCPVAVILMHCGASVTITNSSNV